MKVSPPSLLSRRVSASKAAIFTGAATSCQASLLAIAFERVLILQSISKRFNLTCRVLHYDPEQHFRWLTGLTPAVELFWHVKRRAVRILMVEQTQQTARFCINVIERHLAFDTRQSIDNLIDNPLPYSLLLVPLHENIQNNLVETMTRGIVCLKLHTYLHLHQSSMPACQKWGQSSTWQSELVSAAKV